MENDESSKFALDHACSNLVEAGKKAGLSFLVYLILSATAVIITLSNSASYEMSVPLLKVTMNKWDTSKTIVVLMCAAFYQFIAFHHFQRLLYKKIENLITEHTGGKKSFHWYLYFPSIFFFLEQICDGTQKVVRYPAWGFLTFLLLCSISLPFYLLCIIGKSTQFGITWWIAGILSITLIISAVLMFFSLDWHRDELIENLDKSL